MSQCDLENDVEKFCKQSRMNLDFPAKLDIIYILISRKWLLIVRIRRWKKHI